jgi:hypothetical protein
MKTRWLAIVVVLVVLGALGGVGWGKGNEPVESRIGRLISQLASSRFADRRQASRELEAIGEPALAALRRAVTAADMETCHRARELVAKIEKRLDAAAVMVPTRVRLACKDMPVPDAIAELSRKSRIEILIDPKSRTNLALRKVSLDTGDVTFWEALDALCRKAGLVETTLPIANPLANNTYIIEKIGQLQPVQPMILPAPVMLPANKLVPPKPKAQPQKPRDAKAQPEERQEAKPQKAKPVPAQPQKPKDAQAQPQKPRPAQPKPEKPKDAKAQAEQAKRAAAKVAERVVVWKQLAFLQAPPAPPLQIRQIQLVQAQLRQDLLVYTTAQPTQDLSRIVLADGKPEVLPTCYAGAFRIRARAQAGKDKQSAGLSFEVTAEPRLLGWSLVGTPRLERAGDDRGQVLTLIFEPKVIASTASTMGAWVINGQPNIAWEGAYYHSSVPLKHTVQIQIKLGERPARRLTDLAGQITVDASTPSQPLIVVDDIGKAAGKTVKGDRGGSLTIFDVAKDKSGNYQIRYKLQTPASCTASVPVATTVKDWTPYIPAPARNLLSLLDAQGAAFPVIASSVTNTNGEIVHSLTFQAQQGRRPARLVFSAPRRVNVDVPFAFKDVKLP